ncbi:MAG: magnesium and cobalt transport protein CorA [Candidatus Bathyarchaeum sp.]|nr:MAG: magnesium and cobalt transport protein CorA [Candidatus Bathyarchaeum sp.]
MRKLAKKSGLPPGTPVYVGKKKNEQVKVTCIEYDGTHFEEKELKTIDECFPLKDKPTKTWININGVHKLENIEKIGARLKIHPLALEDIMHTGQRPKMEDYNDYLFIVLKMLQYTDEENETITEQLSIILGSNYVISFQEEDGDVFDQIRERIRTDRGRTRKMGADYLAYSIIDAIVDNYFMVLEKIGEKIEEIEDELVKNPIPEVLHTIHSLKRELIFLRKSVWPLREVISRLERWESPLIDKSIDIYLRDVYDHTIQVIDALETFRDMLSGMLDIYLSSVSNRMNEVMKVLTIIATIFIPLTLIAGIYGMNFKYMPELESSWGYPMVYVVMLAVSAVMLMYFRRKKWL